MKRSVSLILLLVMLISLTACGSKKNEPSNENSMPQLRVGMECAYAPNNWQEDAATETNVPIENVPNAYAEGYDIQIAKRLADSLGYELVVVKLSWDGLIEALNQGQIDAIIAGMADTAERRESISFSAPYHETEYAVMVNQDSPYAGAATINDFAGASILGQKDTKLDTVIDQMSGVNHLNPVSSVPDMISRLQQGTCDGIVINLENAPGYLATDPDFLVIDFAEGDGFDLGFTGACVGLRKSDTELLNSVNEALAAIDESTRSELWESAMENQPR